MHARKRTILLAAAALALPAATPADTDSAGVVDVEIDPTAYVFDGYSLHSGIWFDRFRLDLGAYAMDVPEAVLDNPDFRRSFHGFGAKLQFFPLRPRSGPFVGIDAGASKSLVRSSSSDAASLQRDYGLGVNAGWRQPLFRSFYATAWIGVGYNFLHKDVSLDGKTLKTSPVTVFPAIHLGTLF